MSWPKRRPGDGGRVRGDRRVGRHRGAAEGHGRLLDDEIAIPYVGGRVGHRLGGGVGYAEQGLALGVGGGRGVAAPLTVTAEWPLGVPLAEGHLLSGGHRIAVGVLQGHGHPGDVRTVGRPRTGRRPVELAAEVEVTGGRTITGVVPQIRSVASRRVERGREQVWFVEGVLPSVRVGHEDPSTLIRRVCRRSRSSWGPSVRSGRS